MIEVTKKIIACVYIVLLLVASRLAFTYIYNEYVINKYDDGELDINMKPVTMCNWLQPYIAHYNLGNIHYQNGDYEKAIEEYKLAMKKEPKSSHKCDIRVNIALAAIKTLPEDYSSQENIENTIKVLEEAKKVLIEAGCAKKDEDGHDEEATKLREEIDDILDELNQKEKPEEEGGESKEPQNQPGEKEPEEQREQEIKEQLKQQQNNAYKNRYEDEMFYEEYEQDFGDYFYEPVW